MIKLKRIKTKLLLSFGVVLLLSLILTGYSIYTLYKVLDYKTVSEAFDKMNISVLELRKTEKDFLMREHKRPDFYTSGKSKYWDSNNEIAADLRSRIDSLANRTILKHMGLVGSLHDTKEYLEGYSEEFNKIAEKTKSRGFKDWGDIGELRASIHSVEEMIYPYDKVLMLMLRRHEKDFFLRKDLKYLEKFNDGIEDFKNSIQAADSSVESEENRSRILNSIDDYKAKFEQIVATEQTIGLNEKEGLLGALRESVHQIGPIVANMNHVVKTKTDELIYGGTTLLIVALLIQFTIGAILAFIFSGSFTKSTIQIKDAIVQLSNGEYPDRVEITSNDEFGEAQSSLNNLVERVKTATDFSKKIGNGELDAQYNENYQNDVLAKALLSMHSKLVHSAMEDERRNWTTSGIAHFERLLRENQDNVKELGNKVVSELVEYMKANQANLYMLNTDNEDDVHMELLDSYAWDRDNLSEDKIELSQGLIGQAWQEGKVIYMDKVPSDYISITSGLGEAVPTCVLIQPLKVDNEIFGIIELASFHELKTHELNFMEKIGKSIGSTMSGVLIAKRTKLFLEQLQQQTDEMRTQEEEMRQSQEELKAIQEGMERQKTEMEVEIQELKAIVDTTNT